MYLYILIAMWENVYAMGNSQSQNNTYGAEFVDIQISRRDRKENFTPPLSAFALGVEMVHR